MNFTSVSYDNHEHEEMIIRLQGVIDSQASMIRGEPYTLSGVKFRLIQYIVEVEQEKSNGKRMLRVE